MKLKVLDLFSGIGGFSLGLERAGMETVAFCEIEKYPQSILKKHWPDTPIYEDVRKLDGKQFRDTVELICGGFPCQPFSVAGKQRGKEDDRHLWPEMLRLIKEVRPTWVIGENVAGFIRMALDDVLSDLEAEGYATQSYVIPACAVGAIHRRDRVWVIAHTDRKGESIKPFNDKERERILSNPEHDGWHATEIGQSDSSGNDRSSTGKKKAVKSTRSSSEGGGNVSNATIVERHERLDEVGGKKNAKSGVRIKTGTTCSIVANTNTNTNNDSSERLRQHRDKVLQEQKADGCNETCIRENRNEFKPIRLPTQPPVCHRDDGVQDRVARLKALGNAVVPQIPEMIGRMIMKIENE